MAVWINAIQEMPEDYMTKHLKIGGTKCIGSRKYKDEDDFFVNVDGDLFPPDQVEWLDESVTPVFTLEQIKDAFNSGVDYGCNSDRRYVPDIKTYFKTQFNIDL